MDRTTARVASGLGRSCLGRLMGRASDWLCGLADVKNVAKSRILRGRLAAGIIDSMRARTSMRVVGILLAAGQGSRFGGDKLLAKLADGTPIGVRSARNLRSAIEDVIAVTRPGDDLLSTSLQACDVVVETCPRAHEGMGASLAHAVRASADAGGWVVALADMPQIRPDTIRLIVAALERGAGIVAPAYRGERGHPVGFAGRFGPALMGLGGDAGARDILRGHRDSVELIEVDDPGVLADIDTPAALERIGSEGR